MSKKDRQIQSVEVNKPPIVSPITAAAAAGAPRIGHSLQIATNLQLVGSPFPPPEIIRQYNQVTQGLGERLVKMAEDEATHRRTIEATMVESQRTDLLAYRRSELVGQIFGLTIGVAAIGGATYMAVHGAQWAASFIGTGGVTGVVTAFILGRNMLLKQRRQEFEQQQQALQQQAQQQQALQQQVLQQHQKLSVQQQDLEARP